ncbi:hypothetical protein R6Q59_024621 [Mikania micrantha]
MKPVNPVNALLIPDMIPEMTIRSGSCLGCMMEQKHSCASICDRLPNLFAMYPWLVDHNLDDDNKDSIFYTTRNPFSQFRCQIPAFLGKRIRGCFYGWVILSNHPHNDMWSLWNPVTSKIIRLPRLLSEGVNRAQSCCLSSPPDNHGSIFMLIVKNHTIVFCRLDCKRKRLKWVEMPYIKQMRSLVGSNAFLRSLASCDGKVYALNTGCCTEWFYVELGLREVGHVTKETVCGVGVFKLDMTNMRWEEMVDLKDASFFLDHAHGYSIQYSPAIASELGGHVHFFDRSGKVMNSYDLKNQTIALSFLPTTLFEHRLQGNHGEIKSQQEENSMVDEVDANCTRIEESMESCLLNIPFDVLKMIMDFCVGVEYLNFRATCKQCHLAAPMALNTSTFARLASNVIWQRLWSDGVRELLLVIMGEFGEAVEAFKLSDSIEWEKIESLGRHVIYIGGKTCLCIKAKTPVQANRIYFPFVHSGNRKMVFYSLETRRYHTSNLEQGFADFIGTKHHLDPHVWIEPSWL